MKLYHFTKPANVRSIVAEGLKPLASEEQAFMTNGIPVVWLTRQSHNKLTVDDAAHLNKLGIPAWEGQRAFGGNARINVDLDLNSKRLKRYSDFLWEIKSPVSIVLSDSAHEDWFIYLGVIRPERIDEVLPDHTKKNTSSNPVNTARLTNTQPSATNGPKTPIPQKRNRQIGSMTTRRS